jgi:hypothetical protein
MKRSCIASNERIRHEREHDTGPTPKIENIGKPDSRLADTTDRGTPGGRVRVPAPRSNGCGTEAESRWLRRQRHVPNSEFDQAD